MVVVVGGFGICSVEMKCEVDGGVGIGDCFLEDCIDDGVMVFYVDVECLVVGGVGCGVGLVV